MSPSQINEKTIKNIEKCMKIKERSTKINENPWHTHGHEQDPEQDVTRLREQDPEQGIYKKPVVTLSVKNSTGCTRIKNISDKKYLGKTRYHQNGS